VTALRSRRVSRLAAAVLCGCVAVAGAAPAARADADPASDYLITQSAFFPYSSPVSKPLADQLGGLLASAKKDHLPIKVALIAAPTDLGGVTNAFGRPQAYARFLGQEISFNTRQPLLVVMPAGYGVSGLPAKASAALKGLPTPGTGGDALTRRAVVAVSKIAEATGHHVTVPKLAAGSSSERVSSSGRRHSGGGSSVIPFLVPILLLGAAAAGAAVLGRRRAAAADDGP
jgi:hypothetical protein